MASTNERRPRQAVKAVIKIPSAAVRMVDSCLPVGREAVHSLDEKATTDARMIKLHVVIVRISQDDIALAAVSSLDRLRFDHLFLEREQLIGLWGYPNHQIGNSLTELSTGH